MKKLSFASEEYEAERIVKTETEVIGYTNGQEVFRFSGIRNMGALSVDGGWDLPELSTEEELEAYKKRVNEMENALLGLMEMNMEGVI